MTSYSQSQSTAPASVATRLPEAPHPQAGLTVSSEWLLGTPQRQREAAERVVGAWLQRPWPDGLYSYALFLADDGDTLRHYSQWRDEAAFTTFQTSARDERLEGIDAAVPGIARQNLDHYRVYRSYLSGESAPASPFVVFAAGEGEGAARLRAFVDAHLAEAEPSATPGDSDGLVAAHFHLNTAGTRMLNYAVWNDEAAHRAAMAAPAGPNDPPPLDNPQITRLHHFATLLPQA